MTGPRHLGRIGAAAPYGAATRRVRRGRRRHRGRPGRSHHPRGDCMPAHVRSRRGARRRRGPAGTTCANCGIRPGAGSSVGPSVDDDRSVANQRSNCSRGFTRAPSVPITSVETHISIVAFQGDRVYKLKKAVRFPFVDLSTPALRLADCEREVKLNRRLAPDVYLGVEPVAGDRRRGTRPRRRHADGCPIARRLSVGLPRRSNDAEVCVDRVAAVMATFSRRGADRGSDRRRGLPAMPSPNSGSESSKSFPRRRPTWLLSCTATSRVGPRCSTRASRRGTPATGTATCSQTTCSVFPTVPASWIAWSSTSTFATATSWPTWRFLRWTSNGSAAPIWPNVSLPRTAPRCA